MKNLGFILDVAKFGYRIGGKLIRFGEKLVYLLLSLIPPKLKSNIAITYASDVKTDGLGAQLQRIIAIRALAMRFRINYMHTPIGQVAVHPLDDFGDEEAKENFLKRVEDTFHLESDVNKDWPQVTISHTSLNLRTLVRTLLRSISNKERILLRVVEPYSVMELIPSDYLKSMKYYVRYPFSNSSSGEIVLHYRYGVGGSVIQPGEKIPRQLDLVYFQEGIRECLKKKSWSPKTLRVLTDAPAKDIVFRPEDSQLHLWKGTPGFANGKVEIKGFSFSESLGNLGVKLKVDSGGDALESILVMSRAEILFVSRSSLSYIGALFNICASEIHSAPGFWHPRMKAWK